MENDPHFKKIAMSLLRAAALCTCLIFFSRLEPAHGWPGDPSNGRDQTGQFEIREQNQRTNPNSLPIELRAQGRDPYWWQEGPVVETHPLLLLPDLATLPPKDLRLIEINLESHRRLIVRFTNLIWNRGYGSLEVHGEVDPVTSTITVTQYYSALDGSVGEKRVGEFIFHPEHDHWHLAGFASYEVWSLTPAGELDERLSMSGKVSYCLMDTDYKEVAPSRLPPARQHYITCTALVQGITPGWLDVYKSHLAGQWVEITSLPDGVYALVSTVDPLDQVLEMDEHNNHGITYFELKGRRILSFGDDLSEISGAYE